MSNRKTSELTAATTLVGAAFPASQGGASVRVPIGLFFLVGSATIDFADTATDAVSATSNITVAGASVGDWVLVSANGNIATTDKVELIAKVTAADTVEVYLRNDSGGNFNAASQVINVIVIPKASFGL